MHIKVLERLQCVANPATNYTYLAHPRKLFHYKILQLNSKIEIFVNLIKN